MLAGEYKSNQTDKSIKINRMSDLNKARRTELTVYAARLVNSIRSEFVSNHWIVSDGAIKFAGDVANNYTSDGWKINLGHYVPGINKAAAVSGLYSTATANMYENLTAGYTGVLAPNNWNLSLDVVLVLNLRQLFVETKIN
ncbi:SEC10/PgrA surface exclusion domain-containing protein [Enterococcus pseudoavium]|uniref:SEC10/PgrA surface exclusion domain-containing protein n=2 Tax=Enterococcus pseudoavium TaxID=44007 RepID=UPI0031E247EE